MTTAGLNVDAAELAKFAARAEAWWDPAGPFKTLHDINPLRLEYIARRVPLAGSRVLDVGCGGGLLAEGMARRGAAVTGIDLAEQNLRIARQHAQSGGLTIEYACRDVAAVAAGQPGRYDVVTCMELLEHVPAPEAIVSACAEALRPNGSVVLSTINRNLKSFLLAIVGAEYLLDMVPRGTHDYMKLIRPAEAAGWCRQAGLRVEALTGLHFNPLTQRYFQGGNVDVNYFLWAVKPGEPV